MKQIRDEDEARIREAILHLDDHAGYPGVNAAYFLLGQVLANLRELSQEGPYLEPKIVAIVRGRAAQDLPGEISVKHIVSFSGGKDSTALILWAKEKLPEFTTVFCDTGWEHPITYAYIEEINQTLLDGKLVTLRSVKYDGMRGLVQIKKRAPSAKARFCTDALKVEPMIAWLRSLDDEVTVYQGIRADESASRAKMTDREWSDSFDAWVERPLLRWSAADCFALMKRHSVKPNPLYLMGAERVGCFPCVMVNMRELKAYLSGELGAELKSRVLELEALVGQSFFEPTYIPERFCSGFDPKSGKTFPWAADVFRYIESVDENQLPMFPARSCMSVYNLCE